VSVNHFDLHRYIYISSVFFTYDPHFQRDWQWQILTVCRALMADGKFSVLFERSSDRNDVLNVLFVNDGQSTKSKRWNIPNQIYMLRKNKDPLKRISYFSVPSKERMGLDKIHLFRLPKAVKHVTQHTRGAHSFLWFPVFF